MELQSSQVSTCGWRTSNSRATLWLYVLSHHYRSVLRRPLRLCELNLCFSFSSRIRPHSWERWPVVRVGVAVHHGRQETGRGADRQGTLGQVRTELLLQVKGLNNLWSCAFTTGLPVFALIYLYIGLFLFQSWSHFSSTGSLYLEFI